VSFGLSQNGLTNPCPISSLAIKVHLYDNHQKSPLSSFTIPREMQFIDDEGALHDVPPPPELDSAVPSSIINPPFPFLKLPREIRDSIYYYALLRPGLGPFSPPAHVCHIHSKVSGPRSTTYWGTEKSTRLFRVNRQVSSEASEIFYSSFQFHFLQSADVGLVNATLRDTLTPRARNLIRAVGFNITLRTSFPTDPQSTEKRRQVLTAVVQLLPALEAERARVELCLSFLGIEVPEGEVRKIVDRAVWIASPLKDVKTLVLKGPENENAQRMRIAREVREALGCL
jgi:hypothetical protein